MKNFTIVKIPKTENEIALHDLINIPDGSIDNLKMGNILDYTNDRHTILMMAFRKIKYDGTIEIHGFDILEIGRLIFTGRESLEEMNKLIFNGKQSLDNIFNLLATIKQAEFVPIIRQLFNCKYYVKARRPRPN
jgi:hypothetical protein